MKGKILIVDDSEISRLLMCTVLSDAGYDVIPVGNGEDALAELENNNADLILLDINMPGMNGFTLCNIIKSTQKFSGIPVIFITGTKEKDLTLKGFQCGAVDFLTKPFEPEELLARVTVHIELIKSKNELLYLSKKAEESNRIKGEFLANMSHEIRTPMSAIIGFTELLLSTSITPIQRDYLEMIDISANSLLDIINDILDISKLQSGKFTITKSSCCLKTLIQSIIHTYIIQSMKKGVNLTSEIDEDIDENILTDPTRLRQILINLVGNSVKFTDDGEIKVKIQKRMENSTEKIIFSVTDTGIGIPSDKLNMLFDPFSQLEHSAHKKVKGSGLGLSICKSLTELLGGSITVESREGKGSTFSFDIPFEKAPDSDNLPIEETESLESYSTNINILVADDYFVNQKMITALLEKKGWNVSIASNGLEVLEKIENNNYDLILMDMHMPEMDGLTASQIIREREKNSNMHIPIIALTANAFPQDREKCFTAGMDSFLSKPVNQETLYREIVRLIGDKIITSDNCEINPEENSKPLTDFNYKNFSDFDEEGLNEIIEYYINDFHKQVVELGKFLEIKNYKEIEETAHKIKGSLLNINASEAVALALQIEKDGKYKDCSNSNEKYIKLKYIINCITEEMKQKLNS